MCPDYLAWVPSPMVAVFIVYKIKHRVYRQREQNPPFTRQQYGYEAQKQKVKKKGNCSASILRYVYSIFAHDTCDLLGVPLLNENHISSE